MVTITNIPPYNTYTLRCDASLLPDQQTLSLNISWWDFATGAELLSNDSITIQTSTTSGTVGEQSVAIHSSELTISEIGFSGITDTTNVLRACSANVVYEEVRGGETITRVYPRAVTATRSVIIRGW